MERKQRLVKSIKDQLSRRTFMTRLTAAGLGVTGKNLLGSPAGGPDQNGPVLENNSMRLFFDSKSGFITKIENRLTNETIPVKGDDFRVVAKEFTLGSTNTLVEAVKKTSNETVQATYFGDNGLRIRAVYRLGQNNHFFEKRVSLTSPAPYRLTHVVISELDFSGISMKWIRYPHLKCTTYFGRSDKGGIFLGMELPFDDSSMNEQGLIALSYAPSLKVRANVSLVCEASYCGVYKKEADDSELPRLGLRESLMTEDVYDQQLNDTERAHRPLRSESKAMIELASAVLGPRAKRLLAMLNGWVSQMTTAPYRSIRDAEGDIQSIDFAATCGIDYFSDAHPWAGDFARIGELRDADKLQFTDLVLRVAQHANQTDKKWQLWHSLNNTDPWSPDSPRRPSNDPVPVGKPYRSDQPDWLSNPADVSSIFGPGTKEQGNCFANEPFFEWLYARIVEALEAGHFAGWGIDGDFLGGPGITRPANCPSATHDHLPGDSNYACQRNLNELARRLREKYPGLFLSYARPPMDLGLWALRYVDAVFTIDEYARPIGLPGVGTQPVNVLFGDKIRTWSRIRVQRQFFPHYLDAPQVFGMPKPNSSAGWESTGLDYIMLSALACAPNQIYYLPTKVGIPEEDKRTIRKWLDWGRAHIEYLMVRKDLKDWPASGKVDGFAHIKGDRGFVFLFNPNPNGLTGVFQLNDSIGLSGGERFRVVSIYPAAGASKGARLDDEIIWEVPAQTAVVLEVRPRDAI